MEYHSREYYQNQLAFPFSGIWGKIGVDIHGSGMRMNCAFRENMIQE